jgi:tRNA(fMet)-specific endonuclease VapC
VIRYLADTNILGYFARNAQVSLQQRMLKAMKEQEVAISVITRAETQYGLGLLNASDKRRNTIGSLLEEYPTLPWTADAADRYGEIASHLQLVGKTVGIMDTQIAAHALAENLILVTHNTRHFERVPGLKIEDWMV